MKTILVLVSMFFSVLAIAAPISNTAAEDAAAHKALICFNRERIISFMANRRDMGATLEEYRKAYPVEPTWSQKMKDEVHAIEVYVWLHTTEEVVQYAHNYNKACMNDPTIN